MKTYQEWLDEQLLSESSIPDLVVEIRNLENRVKTVLRHDHRAQVDEAISYLKAAGDALNKLDAIFLKRVG